jgi:hypothetical protein
MWRACNKTFLLMHNVARSVKYESAKREEEEERNDEAAMVVVESESTKMCVLSKELDRYVKTAMSPSGSASTLCFRSCRKRPHTNERLGVAATRSPSSRTMQAPKPVEHASVTITVVGCDRRLRPAARRSGTWTSMRVEMAFAARSASVVHLLGLPVATLAIATCLMHRIHARSGGVALARNSRRPMRVSAARWQTFRPTRTESMASRTAMEVAGFRATLSGIPELPMVYV